MEGASVVSQIASVLLIMLHSPGDGRVIELNPSHIIALRAQITGTKNKHLHNDVQCLIHTVDGKFIAVVETCATVRRLIAEAGKRE